MGGLWVGSHTGGDPERDDRSCPPGMGIGGISCVFLEPALGIERILRIVLEHAVGIDQNLGSFWRRSVSAGAAS